jgi:HK97 family phage major capsid protein
MKRTKKSIMDERLEISQRAMALNEKVKKEDRDMTPEELTAFDTDVAKVEALNAELASVDKHAQALDVLTGAAQPFDQPPPRKTLTIPHTDGMNALGFKTGDVEPEWLKDPKFGFRNMSEFAMAVKEAALFAHGKSQSVHPRLAEIGKMQAAYGNSLDSGAQGGFLVPPEFSNKMYERIVQILPIMEQADKLTLSGRSVEVLGIADYDKSDSSQRHGGIIVYWVEDGNQVTKSNLNFEKIRLDLHQLAALSFVTDTMLREVVNFPERLVQTFANALADEIAEVLMFGNGAGKPQGSFVSPARVSVAKETSQTAATINFTNIIKMFQSRWQSTQKYFWYYTPEALIQLVNTSISLGGGAVTFPVYLPAGGMAGQPYNTLWGRPAIETDHCAAVGTEGDIVLADYSEYLVATGGAPELAESIHLRFDYFETAFRIDTSIDGRFPWKSNVKPRKGSTNFRVSPFVTLASRL